MFRTGTEFNPRTKIWSGPKLEPTYNTNVSVGQIILSAAAKNPNKIIQVCHASGSILSNRELQLRSIRIANKLMSLKLKQGDVLGVVARNTENLAPLVVASLTCGFPISPLDVSFGKDEILHTFGCTSPQVIFCDSDKYDIIRSCTDELHLDIELVIMNGKVIDCWSIDDFLKEDEEEDKFIFPKLLKGGKEIALMGNSSGTSGPSKAVCISHELLLSQFDNLFCGTADDVVFVTSPIYWATWWMNFIYSSVVGATRVITDQPFSPETLLQIIQQHKVSIVLTAASYMLATIKDPAIEQYDLSSVRIYLCAGCSIAGSQVQRMNRYLKNGSIMVGYGMTEIITYFTVQTHPVSDIGSVGKILSNNQIQIVSDNGQKLGINESGEILVKTPVVFSGYHKNCEATRNVLNDEGWLKTGDIGYFNENGELFIVDRKKDLIKNKGFHVVPNVLEAILLSLPGVVEACVVGVPHPISIELPAAAIVKRDASHLTEDTIFDFLASQVSHHKMVIGGVYFMKSLPKTHSGKILRRVVREIVTNLYKTKNKELFE